MIYFIFSDVHSNLEAFESVLVDADRVEYDFALSLGDHVGYGANPNECIELLMSLPKCSAILGNHDAAVMDPGERGFFNEDALSAIIHTANVLNDRNKEFLKGLPLVYDANVSFIGVHASPFKPESWGYILDAWEAADAFSCMDRQAAFTGHSHIPCIITDESEIRPLHSGDTYQLEEGRKYIINVGSVGQPRDRDPRAAYVVFDDVDRTVKLFRVEYEWDKAAEKIIKAGLPLSLARRITVGL